MMTYEITLKLTAEEINVLTDMMHDQKDNDIRCARILKLVFNEIDKKFATLDN
jgi:hypothetical protein